MFSQIIRIMHLKVGESTFGENVLTVFSSCIKLKNFDVAAVVFTAIVAVAINAVAVVAVFV